MNKYIIVDQPKHWRFLEGNNQVISAKEYLTDPSFAKQKNLRVFNLCKKISYQSKGYYVSLLAEARGHNPIPSVKNLVDLSAARLVRIVSDEFDDLIQQSLKNIKSREFTLSIYFGQNVAQKYKELSSMIHRYFQVPFLRVKFSYSSKWNIQQIRAIGVSEVPEEHKASMEVFAQNYFSKKRYDAARMVKSVCDLAILVKENDPAPPSNPKALKRFIEVAEKMNVYAEIITPKDLARLSSFDALFIRQSTEVTNEAYTFARKAQQEHLALIDYPDAILKCCNKVFMAEALSNAGIAAPKTIIVHQENKHTAVHELQLPCVLKAPDSTFSFGVKKAKSETEYHELVDQMLKDSELIIAQEYCPSAYDWRIGVLDGKAFYACRYYMAKDHWQIYNWQATHKNDQDGNADCLPIEEVPENVLETALKAAKIMGQGLLGIDIKEIDGKALVIEINDNPNIDAGVEDRYYGDELYKNIITAFLKRLDEK